MDRIHDRYVVRIAVADLPTSLWDEVIAAVAGWWKAHERRVRLSPQNVEKAAETPSVPLLKTFNAAGCDAELWRFWGHEHRYRY
jgi:hypothetical protein